MIFASDLDQTLIYSRKHMERLHKKERVVIEYKEGLPLSYMSRSSQSLLKEIADRMTFIPVTTRIMEQYQRIDLGIYTGAVPYAVISNGGRILINGEDDKEWESSIKQGLEDECLGLAAVLAYFKQHYSGSWIQSIRIAEELFLYAIVDPEKIPLEGMKEFRIWLDSQNWKLSIQGRKIYFIPGVIQKYKAIEYLSRKLGEKLFAGAGDSFLDLSFLKEAAYPIVPRHGELFQNHPDALIENSIKITSTAGVMASEELLSYVLGSYFQ